MIVLLQRYIFRELVRAFLLTAVALTCMLGFGGSLMDMLKSQGITAGEMVRLLIYLTPVVLAYSLPVAALFSTTITYGRLSADNEINACRASGVNIRKLLLPALALSVIVFAATFALENYVIPELAERVWRLVKRDMQGMAAFHLRRTGFLAWGDYALHCGRMEESVLPQERPDGTTVPGHIQLSQVAFMKQEHNLPVFYGTAKTAWIQFEDRPEGMVISACLNQIRAFDEEKGQLVQSEFYPLARPIEVPSLVPRKTKFLSLPELLATAKEPLRWQELANKIENIHRVLREALACEILMDQFRREKQIRLTDVEHDYTITAASGWQRDTDGSIQLEGDVKVVQHSAEVTRTFLAKGVRIQAKDRDEETVPEIMIFFKRVDIRRSTDVDPDHAETREDLGLTQIQAPAATLARAADYPLDRLMDPNADLAVHRNQYLSADRLEAMKLRTAVVSQTIGEIHSRLTYSSSVLGLLVLGAALGIIFRGGHFVSAFGLSFIPMLLVVVLIITGKRICGVGETQVGVSVMWLGLAVILCADGLILGKFLKR